MRNQEIIDASRLWQGLQKRSATIAADLKERANDGLCIEAAEIIEWLLSRIAGLKKDLNEEIREGQRSAQDAYGQGRIDGSARDD